VLRILCMGEKVQTMQRNIAIGLLPLLGACAATAIPPASTVPAPSASAITTPANPPRQQPRVAPQTSNFTPPRVMNIPGLENVIGKNIRGLQRQFGAPRLNVQEGDARKLQYSGEACVLDIYLYPLSPGAEPTATYVDARRASDGLDVDRAACAAAMAR